MTTVPVGLFSPTDIEARVPYSSFRRSRMFARPVPALDPLGLLRHPGATLTVEDPAALVAALGF